MNDLTPEDIANLRKVATALADESMGDMIYHVRECEGKGFDGPRVKRWGVATAVIDDLRKQGKI